MGIEGVELNEVVIFYSEEKDEKKVKKRFNKIFTGVYDGEVEIDNDEVDFQWMSLVNVWRKSLKIFPMVL